MHPWCFPGYGLRTPNIPITDGMPHQVKTRRVFASFVEKAVAARTENCFMIKARNFGGKC